LGLLGCSGSDQCTIEGEVTFDGQPIDGAIAFLGGGEKARNAGATILNGKYKIAAETGPAPGNYKVQIRWQKKTGKKFKGDDGTLMDDAKEGLPDKYHDNTTLTAEVRPGENKIDFHLKP
jgi:hypothetical protein